MSLIRTLSNRTIANRNTIGCKPTPLPFRTFNFQNSSRFRPFSTTTSAPTNPVVKQKIKPRNEDSQTQESAERKPVWKQRTSVKNLLFPTPAGEEAPLKVNAYCTAESYDFDRLYSYLSKISSKTTRTTSTYEVVYRPIGQDDHGHVFYFEKGSIVVWNCTKEENEAILSEVKQFEINRYDEIQTETMSFLYSGETGLAKDTIKIDFQSDEQEKIAHKLAYSYGMHQSVKLEAHERKAEILFQSMRNIPEQMLRKSRSFTSLKERTEVKQKHAELLKLRADINLYSELLEIPDIFWDAQHLETFYRQISRHLVIETRTATVNKKIDYSNQLNEALRTQLAENYTIRLEWLIIILIAAEVLQGIWSMYHEIYDDDDNLIFINPENDPKRVSPSK